MTTTKTRYVVTPYGMPLYRYNAVYATFVLIEDGYGEHDVRYVSRKVAELAIPVIKQKISGNWPGPFMVRKVSV